jgi:Tfp pilus assembly protein PilP
MISDNQKSPTSNTPMPPEKKGKKVLLPVVFVLCIAFAIFSLSAQKNTSAKSITKSSKTKSHASHNGSKYRPATEPLASNKSYSKDEFNLVGIIYEGADSSAIINNQTVKIGGKINDHTVKDISAERVILINSRNQEKELKL